MTVTQKDKVVGIIGGMGPEATVDLMQQVIAGTPARDDIDHIRMLVDNNPKVPSRIKAIIEGTGESPAPCMIEMAQGLERQGADFLVIPCNTAHFYHTDVASSVSIPVFNLIEKTALHVKKEQPDLNKVGLLASSALQKIHLYEPWFNKLNIQIIYPHPEHQAAVMDLIRAVKANKASSSQIAAYNLAASHLKDLGAECLVLACTELSVIYDDLKTALPVFDASKILASSIIEEVLGPQ
ncbi:amino acid racemase [Marinomonas sp. 15G1-11]|uniref:Amino acid racemase n=1 Tax=Marinomonas phaeophyticola TaxID=3004091 RepID=A0ABT4JTQ1_9GAMM|nr:amino acid racemase [Marinomonas sp. 15G1-11]MCZ2721780.1 amino acid racemase [Marinomonas sp. 15G1-11]